MKTVFLKRHLPLIDKAVHNPSDVHSTNELYCKIRFEDGLDRQIANEILLLQRGAFAGNGYAMLELARHYYYDDCGPHSLPQAISWWQKAILLNEGGAIWDIENTGGEIYGRILSYSAMPSEFANIVMKCALLTEWYLTDLGRTDWSTLTDDERVRRCINLTNAVVPILHIPDVEVKAISNLDFTWEDGRVTLVDGLAHPRVKEVNGVTLPDRRIDLRREMLCDYERLVAVLFHELGHVVVHSIWQGFDTDGKLQKIYGITEDRKTSWYEKRMGYEVETGEEDPDTLSYGVYTNWAVLFASGPDGRKGI